MNVIWIWLGFAFLFGASIGSFLNVLVYRLPEGMSISLPPSHCPNCKHRLAWWENVPILAWFYLGAKCVACRTPISARYVIVETLTALLFAVMFAAFYIFGFRPEYQLLGLGPTLPAVGIHLAMAAGLIAATLIDAKLYIIPLEIPWTVTAIALLVYPVAAYFSPASQQVAPGATGPWIGAAFGGAAGLLLSLGLMWAGVLPRSFDDDPAAHDRVHAGDVPVPGVAAQPTMPDPAAAPATTGQPAGEATPLSAMTADAALSPAATAEAPVVTAPSESVPPPAAPVPAAPSVEPAVPAAPDVVAAATPVSSADSAANATAADPVSAPRDAGPPTDPKALDAWLDHPNLMGEILKECLFLVLPVGAAVAGYIAWNHLLVDPYLPRPAVLQVLAGVLVGYLVGGGVIWFVRIAGTFGFRREALGLGDVHLLAAIGAVMGAFDSVLTLFGAAFLGLAYAAIAFVVGRLMNKRGPMRVIPFGPYLSAAAVLLTLFHGPIEQLLRHWASAGLGTSGLGP